MFLLTLIEQHKLIKRNRARRRGNRLAAAPRSLSRQAALDSLQAKNRI